MKLAVAESSTVMSEGPRTRHERLENRIPFLPDELERLLSQKEATIRDLSSQSSFPPESGSPSPFKITNPESNNITLSTQISSPKSPALPHYQNGASVSGDFQQDISSTRVFSGSEHVPLPGPSLDLDVLWTNWPPNLPGPELLHHLVEVFFRFHPHANRIFHPASFKSTLSLPPSHVKFPSTPVLHAICAIGSFYTAVVTSPPLPDFQQYPPDEIFLQRQRLKEHRADSFAEQQAKYARETADHLNSLGEDLLQVLQVPLGLNMCPPFHSISNSERPASILAPARNVIEDETRRNAFWLAYAIERQHGCANGWANNLDDQDISQLLPVLVSPQERQWAHTKDLLLINPEDQTDSFILYIKGSIMISRVKSFNLRFRSRHFVGDATVASQLNDGLGHSETVDPRGSPAFIELDHIVSSFRASFPAHLKNPISDNIVDNHLYTAFLMPHVAMIVLHDPHADVLQSGCISALKILTAARAILDLIYSVWSTSFDISLLDSFCSFCWFIAGRVLVRFLQAAQDAKSADQISTLRAELDFVQSAIYKMGQRIPLAFRFARLLEDLVVKRCGPAIGTPTPITFPRPIEPPVVHMFQHTSFIRDPQVFLHDGMHEPGSFLTLA
ncbi:hypothetical protein H0H93_008217 [Arthromyces matolae]|nr:hypothetical protein H0H93_008217 [Arthromyces matolae]